MRSVLLVNDSWVPERHLMSVIVKLPFLLSPFLIKLKDSGMTNCESMLD